MIRTLIGAVCGAVSVALLFMAFDRPAAPLPPPTSVSINYLPYPEPTGVTVAPKPAPLPPPTVPKPAPAKPMPLPVKKPAPAKKDWKAVVHPALRKGECYWPVQGQKVCRQ